VDDATERLRRKQLPVAELGRRGGRRCCWPSVPDMKTLATFASAQMRSGVIAVALCVSSCAFIFTDGPPDYYAQMQSVDCNTNPLPAIVDLGLAGLFGLAAGARSGNVGADGPVVVVGGIAVLFVVSAITGFSRSGRCAAAEAFLRQRPAQPSSGCSSDKDCKGDRICVGRTCTEP
jgi:hypothetical protein